MALLEINGLSTHFDTEEGVARAVDGVSLDVEEGETLGVVGESGCGKTVTSLSIMGLIPPPGRILPDSSVRFGGEELVGATNRRLREIRGNEIAMIFQEPMTSLNPVFSVGNQIAEALRAHTQLTKREARTEGVRLLGEVGISEPEQRFDEYPHQLPGGMRQRVMIAMAISCEPRLLIADEPTTALDVTIQAQILELLAGLRKAYGMAMLLITHDLGVVAEVCDRVVVMYAGQVVETGTVEQIFENPLHPYTKGLLASLPEVGGRKGRIDPIPGTVPSPVDWPKACRFYDRCPSAWERCGAEMPELLSPAEARGRSPGRSARCWLMSEAGLRPEGSTEPAVPSPDSEDDDS